jgi:hypothetical protein
MQADEGALAEGIKRDMDEVSRQAAADARALKREAGEQVAAATEKAKSFAGEQKDFLAGQIDGISSAVSKVAGELDQSDQRMVARYARDIAGGLSSVARQVQDNDVDQLMAKAQDFGRKQPLAFLGTAALAGFLASRFAMASAQRGSGGKQAQSDADQSTRPNYAGGPE